LGFDPVLVGLPEGWVGCKKERGMGATSSVHWPWNITLVYFWPLGSQQRVPGHVGVAVWGPARLPPPSRSTPTWLSSSS
jgi:hypothetical protein